MPKNWESPSLASLDAAPIASTSGAQQDSSSSSTVPHGWFPRRLAHTRLIDTGVRPSQIDAVLDTYPQRWIGDAEYLFDGDPPRRQWQNLFASTPSVEKARSGV